MPTTPRMMMMLYTTIKVLWTTMGSLKVTIQIICSVIDLNSGSLTKDSGEIRAAYRRYIIVLYCILVI